MDGIEIKNTILAVVTTNKEQPASGVPVFYAKNEEERNKTASYLSRILAAGTHDLENGSLIIVKH